MPLEKMERTLIDELESVSNNMHLYRPDSDKKISVPAAEFIYWRSIVKQAARQMSNATNSLTAMPWEVIRKENSGTKGFEAPESAS